MSATPTTLQHAIDVACTPELLYAYVTQPWRWHEWHPSSRSARADVEVLKPGDRFDETVALQPFSPLPLTLKRATRYEVLAAEPGVRWEARGQMRDGWLQLRYDFAAIPRGTRFTRTLQYDATGLSRVLLPFLRGRTARLSQVAMANLKRLMERR